MNHPYSEKCSCSTCSHIHHVKNIPHVIRFNFLDDEKAKLDGFDRAFWDEPAMKAIKHTIPKEVQDNIAKKAKSFRDERHAVWLKGEDLTWERLKLETKVEFLMSEKLKKLTFFERVKLMFYLKIEL